ncbi:MAG: CvpA family protein [bacterium]|nr:CvpA family protein [bacterium]
MIDINWIDIVTLVFLIVFFIIGVKRGLIREITELAAFVFGIFCGVFFEDAFEPVTARFLGEFSGIKIITFLAIFFVVALFFVLVGKVLAKFIKFIGMEGLDKFLGGLFGTIKVFIGVLLICIVLFIFNNEKINEYISQSYTGKVVNYVLKQINYGEYKDEIKNLKP